MQCSLDSKKFLKGFSGRNLSNSALNTESGRMLNSNTLQDPISNVPSNIKLNDTSKFMFGVSAGADGDDSEYKKKASASAESLGRKAS